MRQLCGSLKAAGSISRAFLEEGAQASRTPKVAETTFTRMGRMWIWRGVSAHQIPPSTGASVGAWGSCTLIQAPGPPHPTPHIPRKLYEKLCAAAEAAAGPGSEQLSSAERGTAHLSH